MSVDLERQLAEYAEILDSTFADLDPTDVLAAAATHEATDPDTTWAWLRNRPRWAAAIAAIAVLAAIGGASLLFRGDGSLEPADSPEGTVVTPTVTPTQPPPTSPSPATTQPSSEADVIPVEPGSIYFVARWTSNLDGLVGERVERLWYVNSETWRWETPMYLVEDSDELEGQVTIQANGQIFNYYPQTNRFEIGLRAPGDGSFNPSVDGELGLPVAYSCDDSGCVRHLDGDTWSNCTASESNVRGMVTSHFECTRPADGNATEALVLDIDSSGRTWAMSWTHVVPAHNCAQVCQPDDEFTTVYELLELDTSPSFTTDLFEFVCPTDDCVDVETQFNPFTNPSVGQPAPDMVGELVGGGSFDLSDHLGEGVIVTLWAPWCAPCNETLAALQIVQIQTGLPESTIVIGAVISQPEEVEQAIVDLDISFPVVDLFSRNLESGNYPGDVWGLGIPLTIFIDETGTVVAVQFGHEGIGKLLQIIGQLGW